MFEIGDILIIFLCDFDRNGIYKIAYLSIPMTLGLIGYKILVCNESTSVEPPRM